MYVCLFVCTGEDEGGATSSGESESESEEEEGEEEESEEEGEESEEEGEGEGEGDEPTQQDTGETETPQVAREPPADEGGSDDLRPVPPPLPDSPDVGEDETDSPPTTNGKPSTEGAGVPKVTEQPVEQPPQPQKPGALISPVTCFVVSNVQSLLY